MADIIIDKEIISKDYKKFKSMGEVLFDKKFKKQLVICERSPLRVGVFFMLTTSVSS